MSNDEERLLNAELLVEHWMGRYYAADGQREKVEQRIKELEDNNKALSKVAKDGIKRHRERIKELEEVNEAMLAVLKELLKFHEQGVSDASAWNQEMDIARAAIAQAEGKV